MKFNMGKFRGAIFNMNFINAERASISQAKSSKSKLSHEDAAASIYTVTGGAMKGGKIDRTPIKTKDPRTMGKEFARGKIKVTPAQVSSEW